MYLVLECNVLIDKVVDIIHALVLIKYVMGNLHSYWARIFMLSSTILARIEAICRNFLWHGEINAHSPPLVAWSTVCKAKREGGLGVVDIRRRNLAALGKYVWWIMQKKDHLWVKWVHSIYLKGADWRGYNPPNSESWAWRKLCWVKERLGAGYFGTDWLREGWLGTTGVTIQWSDCVWNKQKLLTKDRLCRWGLDVDSLCDLCGQQNEYHSHLFSKCTYSRRFHVEEWCRCDLSRWLRLEMGVGVCWKVWSALAMVVIYSIWWARNQCRERGELLRPEVLLSKFSVILQNRIRHYAQRRRP
ncbi:hypothetical protein RND81_13G122000 [Saponaria officinalis]|uniref:Reverse transcriptase zinc-binding domain-containing protein n=1 Tax=Saponaria officinalis TaxID=3572 RepID=A0AAW1GZ06_SAPOF